jgi:hypothetical protein
MLKAPSAPPGPPPAGRAGAYGPQPTGYQAFIPAPLPPDPPVRIDGPLQALLSRADLALGRLAGSIETLPNPDLFILMYVRKEAVLSSQIEGTQSSRTGGGSKSPRPSTAARCGRGAELRRRHESRPRTARLAAGFRAHDP